MQQPGTKMKRKNTLGQRRVKIVNAIHMGDGATGLEQMKKTSVFDQS